MYRELVPPAHLAGHVACSWFQTADDRAFVHRVVPDGCADIVSMDGGPPFVVGPATAAVLVPIAANATVVGIRFRPGMAAAALGVAAIDILNREVPLADLWGDRVAQDLWNEIALPRSLEDRRRALQNWVTVRLATRGRAPDTLVCGAVRWLARHPDRHIGELVGSLGISSRQLLRRFRTSVGYGPKVLHRVLRFQRLLIASHDHESRSLARLAMDCGYADQAHMTREVVGLTGTTPTLLLKAAFAPDAMSDFFKTTDAL